ncbi:ISL3 family transposase [Streptomyces sp.]
MTTRVRLQGGPTHSLSAAVKTAEQRTRRGNCRPNSSTTAVATNERSQARKGDAIYTVRKLLRRNKEDLTEEQHTLLKAELGHMGTYGRQIYAGWQAKELLRDLLHLDASRTHVTPDRSAVSATRYRYLAHVADHAHLPELVTLAETVEQWWDGIETYLTTGITNTASEGNNSLIKLEARNAFGFRNRENQRLRSHCATTRRSRREAHPH